MDAIPSPAPTAAPTATPPAVSTADDVAAAAAAQAPDACPACEGCRRKLVRPRYEGQRIRMRDGLTYTCPPLTMREVRQNRELLHKLTVTEQMVSKTLADRGVQASDISAAAMDDEYAQGVCQLAWVAFRHNYPDLTYAIVDPATGAVEEVLRGVDALLGLVDARTIRQLAHAIWAQSGYGENGAPRGEAGRVGG